MIVAGEFHDMYEELIYDIDEVGLDVGGSLDTIYEMYTRAITLFNSDYELTAKFRRSFQAYADDLDELLQYCNDVYDQLKAVIRSDAVEQGIDDPDLISQLCVNEFMFEDRWTNMRFGSGCNLLSALIALNDALETPFVRDKLSDTPGEDLAVVRELIDEVKSGISVERYRPRLEHIDATLYDIAAFMADAAKTSS